VSWRKRVDDLYFEFETQSKLMKFFENPQFFFVSRVDYKGGKLRSPTRNYDINRKVRNH